MIVGINTPSDTQAEQIKASKAIFTSYRVAVCEDITDFTTMDTGLQIQLDSESLRRELFFYGFSSTLSASTTAHDLRQVFR